ncbi:MAG: beta-N-acetylhexosaminidase [Ktedonobacteraceae bacterium]
MGNYTGGMTQEEQIGQTLMAGFRGYAPSQEIIDLIQRCHVGNIILFSRYVRDARQVLELTQRLQMIAREAGHAHPLLIAIDQENGIVQRLGEAATIFPGNMALGAIGSEEIASQVALATGRELKALGINMNLAPVVDVNNNLANPVIGVRSFGEDPRLVARLGSAMVKGYYNAGVISCLNHFPGHGDTAVDSHLALPTIPHTLERLEVMEMVPFRSGIEAGAESVMIAHIAFLALSRNELLPATLSPAIIHGLLREKLGFNGVILSDCLEMGAISETFGTQRAAVMALQTGINLVLVSHLYTRQQGSIEAITEAVQTGELSSQTIRLAAERVLSLKARYLSWDDLYAPTDVDYEAHARLQDQAYELSTTLAHNEDTLVPLHPNSGERIVIVAPHRNTMTMVEDRYYSDDMLLDIIRKYHADVSLKHVSPADDWRSQLQATAASDTFIVATVNAHLDEGQAGVVRFLVSTGRRVIALAVRNPYDLQAFPRLRTYLAT